MADAFRFMAQARHVGKVVVRPPATAAAARIRDDASYLVTGGLGALGVRVAEWLHARGARHLALMGRSAPTPAVAERLARLELDGTVVRVIRGDVARDEDVRAALAEIAGTLPALRGVVHAAGVVDDAVLSRLTPASLAAVLGAEGGGGVEPARALRGVAARLLRRLLVDRLRARVAGAGQLRRRQRLPRRAGRRAARHGPARAVRELGAVGRGRDGGRPGRA